MKKRWAGFTLLELLVVISIMGVLMGLLLPAIFKVKGRARDKRVAIEQRTIASAISAYRLRYHKWPVDYGSLNVNNLQDETYGGDDYDNRIVFDRLAHPPDGNSGDSDEPVIDLGNYRVDNGGNVLNPWGNQIQITFDLNEDFSPSGGVSVNAGIDE